MILNDLRSLSWLAALLLLQIPCQGQTPRPASNTGTGFYVVGRQIYDANGIEFDIRGFSNSHLWGNTTNTFNAISEFPATKANVVRATFGPAVGGLQDSPAKRKRVVQEYIKNGIVPVVEDHGATGSTDPVPFRQVVDRWVDPGNVQWLKQYEQYVILNIANEWGPCSTVWRDEYINAVARIRAAGINCLLMIDAGGYGGQQIDSIDTWWKEIEDSDPQHNIVFSVHMYGFWSSSDRPRTHWDINTELDKAVQMNIPLVVGEFSWQEGDVCYNTRTAMRLFTEHDIGWIAWSWNGNGNYAYDMKTGGWQYTSDETLSQFGNLVINDPVLGLKATSKQATIFSTLPTPASTVVKFASSETKTQGNWKGPYGNDGTVIPGQTSLPTYATVTPANQWNWTWVDSTTDTRALQKGNISATDRIASSWFSRNQLSVDINLTDGQSHTVSIYAVDWDSNNRSERVDVVDPRNGAVLDSQTISSFHGGTYLTWNLKGHVQLRFTKLISGTNAVVSGIFFDPATAASSSAASPSATFISSDTATQGNWRGRYGTEGYKVLGCQAPVPTYAIAIPANQLNWTWARSTTDARALQDENSSAIGRIASCWFAYSQFSVDINLTDGQSHTVSIYAVDWDSNSRSERVDVIDPRNGAVLDSQTISSFHGGTYLTWNLKGYVQLRFTKLSGANAVVSGIFFDTVTNPVEPSATFVSSDATSQGNWKGHYGSDGYDITSNQVNLPMYANIPPADQLNWTWAGSTTDTRALQNEDTSATDRIASCWFSFGQFSVDINLTDGQSHTVSIYAVDWDGNSRSERVDVIDPRNGAVLDSQTISSFHGGTYLTWNLKGHVQLRFTKLSGNNAVVSGIFFGNPT